MTTDIIIHDKKDNVGVVVIEKTSSKQDCNCWVMEDDSSANIQSIDEIPLGHKIEISREIKSMTSKFPDDLLLRCEKNS